MNKTSTKKKSVKKPQMKPEPVKKTQIKLAVTSGIAGITGLATAYYFLNKSKKSKKTPEQETDNIMNEVYEIQNTTPQILDSFINIYMVYYGYRQASLIEPANYKDGSYKKLFPIIKKLNLYYSYDRAYRILVTKRPVLPVTDDKILGKLLGFHCYNHNYSDLSVDRVGGSIKINDNITVYAEVCEYSKLNIKRFKKHLQNLADNYKKLVPLFTVSVHLQKNDSYKTRFQKFKANDMNYIKTHIDDYNNDLFNEFTSEWEEIEAEDLMKPLNRKVYTLAYEGYYSKLYPKFTGSDENIREIDKISKKLMNDYKKERYR